jgi:nitrite reductase/ring-hydroxylating ferredoxin subunit
MPTPDMSPALWRKSSHSAQNGACVEVAAWHTSSYSARNGNCLEATANGAVVAVRDNKDPDGPHLEFAPAGWRTFAARLKVTPARV